MIGCLTPAFLGEDLMERMSKAGAEFISKMCNPDISETENAEVEKMPSLSGSGAATSEILGSRQRNVYHHPRNIKVAEYNLLSLISSMWDPGNSRFKVIRYLKQRTSFR
jgi:hypothetical protein